MIEGLLRHCTDAEIEANYVDTHGASLVGFAFTELLGFRMLPRLKTSAPSASTGQMTPRPTASSATCSPARSGGS
jgi:hypothetical protein